MLKVQTIRIVLTTLVLLALLVSLVRATPFELSYDDGEFDYGWSDFYPSAAMVKFFPPSPSWKIESIRIRAVCSLKGSGIFYVQIWDRNLNTKYSTSLPFSSVFKDGVLDWYTIKLPNVVVTGEFYVVVVPMFTLDGPQLWLGVDDDPPISNMSFIVDTNKHVILTSLNATSKRPSNFMIRVIGEATSVPSEIKLLSVNVSEKETTVVFSYPGEIMNFGARLVKKDGSFIEENVTRDGQNLIVKLREEGTLNVFVVTPSSEIVGTSVRLETSLRDTYNYLLANYTILEMKADEMNRQIESLTNENEKLRISVRDQGYAIEDLQKQVWELMNNITRQKRQIAELNANIERLKLENTISKVLLVVAIITPVAFLAFRKLRMKR